MADDVKQNPYAGKSTAELGLLLKDKKIDTLEATEPPLNILAYLESVIKIVQELPSTRDERMDEFGVNDPETQLTNIKPVLSAILGGRTLNGREEYYLFEMDKAMDILIHHRKGHIETTRSEINPNGPITRGLPGVKEDLGVESDPEKERGNAVQQLGNHRKAIAELEDVQLMLRAYAQAHRQEREQAPKRAK